MREVVLDTETTGLNPRGGDRVVEIGCVELLNHVPTGRTAQWYVNPEREMPPEAFAVHGLSTEFLAEQPTFAEVAPAFLDFVADSPLIIHNADFDLGFLNAELARLDRPPIARERGVDTVQLARRKFPGAPANLDALCRRFAVDLSDRALHGALKDSLLLAEVYLQLLGGRQPGLALAASKAASAAATGPRAEREPRPHAPSADEATIHAAFLDRMVDPIWRRA